MRVSRAATTSGGVVVAARYVGIDAARYSLPYLHVVLGGGYVRAVDCRIVGLEARHLARGEDFLSHVSVMRLPVTIVFQRHHAVPEGPVHLRVFAHGAVEGGFGTPDLVQHVPSLVHDGVPVFEVHVVGAELKVARLPTPENFLHAKVLLGVAEVEEGGASVVVAHHVRALHGHLRGCPKRRILCLGLSRHAIGVQDEGGVLICPLLGRNRLASLRVVLHFPAVIAAVSRVVDHAAAGRAALLTESEIGGGGGTQTTLVKIFRIGDDGSHSHRFTAAAAADAAAAAAESSF